jgi:4-hydroxy-3-polyprenylbenzoate decarboxylase
MALRVLVEVTGASGIIYAIRLISFLYRRNMLEAVVYTDAAALTAKSEGIDLEKFLNGIRAKVYKDRDVWAEYASSSNVPDAVVVIPCSMKTLSAIAYGYADNLIVRAALAALRMGRKLILVVRETPLGLAELRAMLRAGENGAIILPASPAFYHRPRHLADIVNFIVGKVLDVLSVEHNLYRRWSGYSISSSPI